MYLSSLMVLVVSFVKLFNLSPIKGRRLSFSRDYMRSICRQRINGIFFNAYYSTSNIDAFCPHIELGMARACHATASVYLSVIGGSMPFKSINFSTEKSSWFIYIVFWNILHWTTTHLNCWYSFTFSLLKTVSWICLLLFPWLTVLKGPNHSWKTKVLFLSLSFLFFMSR